MTGGPLCSFVIAMKPADLPLRIVMLLAILLLFGSLHAKPLDYEDVANLLPTQPQTTNDTLAAVVRDPVVQDAVQNAVGNGSLQGLVVKKKVFVMPATEPTKVVSQREQVLVVPMTHLEDVRKNITDAGNAERNAGNGLALPEVRDEDATLASHEGTSTDSSARDYFYGVLTNIPERATRGPKFPVDNMAQEIPQFPSNPPQDTQVLPEQPSISLPIIAFLDPTGMPDDKIDAPIATALPGLENRRGQIQPDARDQIDGNPWSVDLDNWQRTSPPSERQPSSSLFEPAATETRYVNDVGPENSLRFMTPRIDIVTPLFWTADVDDNYPRDPHDMDVAADIVFRPLFRYRQEAQEKSYRRSAYRRYSSYDSYPRRNYRYRSRYSNDYYY